MNFSVPEKLVIASRESPLAMWQAEHVRDRLKALYPACDVQILGMTTRGDQILDRALSKVGGKGLFVKELEVAMSEGRADLAVHSLKDVPMELPDGFELAAILEREDPRDAFVSSVYANLSELPAGSIVGTSSLRRQAMIAQRYPHLEIRPLRGNLGTRLRKLDDGEYAAIILAAAGLKRLGMPERIRTILDPVDSLPAAGQGAMAIEIPAGRPEIAAILAPLNHTDTALSVHAERVVSRAFGGSCQVPLAAHVEIAEGQARFRAMIASVDGVNVAKADMSASVQDLGQLTKSIIQSLEDQDAAAILAACRSVAE